MIKQGQHSTRTLCTARPCFVTLATLCVSFTLVYVVVYPWMAQYEHPTRPLEAIRDLRTSIAHKNTVKNQLKIILYWAAESKGHAPYLQHNCSGEVNCLTSQNKGMLKQASAVILDWFYLRKDTQLPDPRPANQTYVFYMQESPWRKPRSFFGMEKDYFDLTMTYRRDSDIPIPYGEVTTTASALPYDQALSIVAGKTKLIAWFVSHCSTHSKREDYVTELQKFVPVDIYGKCGPLNCTGKRSSKCYDMLEKDYKFYLGFENSICKDYVTEKVFNMLGRYVVPIVYGGANYSALTPLHSVINAQDFTSPKHLAEYLIKLAGDEERYMQYFEWKKGFGIMNAYESRSRGFCKLCELLNSRKHQVSHKHNLTKWWLEEGTCDSQLINKLLQP